MFFYSATPSVNRVLLVVEGDHAADVLPHLTQKLPPLFRGRGIIAKGKLKNLAVTVHDREVVIFGSLPVFAYGPSVRSLGLREIPRVLHGIADALGLDRSAVLGAQVPWLTFGADLPVSRPPADYVPHLVDVPRARRRPLKSGGVVFKNRNRELAFYDPASESAAQGQGAPQREGGSVLRYELRFLRGVETEFWDELTAFGYEESDYEESDGGVLARHLADPVFYGALVDRWRDRFDSVRCHRPARHVVRPTVRELRDTLALRGIEAAGGIPAVRASIDEDRAAGRITAQEASRLRAWLRRVTASPVLTEESTLVKELHTAVRGAATRARLHAMSASLGQQAVE